MKKIFADYLRLGSIGELAAALDREGVRPRPRKLASGKTIAAARFMVGPLAHMLKNRFYVGEIAYRGEIHRASTSRSSIAISSTRFRRDWPKAPSSESSRDHVPPPCS